MSTAVALITEITALLTPGKILPFWLPAVLFVLLAYFNSVGAIAVALTMEGNPKGRGALAIGFYNFMAYVIVAVFGNLFGLILDRFTVEKLPDGRIVSPANAYSAIWGIMIFFTLIGLYCACKIPKNSIKVLCGDKNDQK